MLQITLIILTGFAIAEFVSHSTFLSAIVVLLGMAALIIGAVKLLKALNK